MAAVAYASNSEKVSAACKKQKPYVSLPSRRIMVFGACLVIGSYAISHGCILIGRKGKEKERRMQIALGVLLAESSGMGDIQAHRDTPEWIGPVLVKVKDWLTGSWIDAMKRRLGRRNDRLIGESRLGRHDIKQR
eukprot:scaffold162_cov176-Amphora_coffeaeformis.AAC.5